MAVLCWLLMLCRARFWILLACPLIGGCSPATMGMNRMADALTATASAYARDDDPEFVRTGAPATLKMIEMMLDRQPDHPGLLMSACSGFTQYAYAFLHLESEIARGRDPAAERELRDRAIRMYGRARGYCVRALAQSRPRLAESLTRDPRSAIALLDSTTPSDVPALFWTAAAWGGEFSLAGNQLVRMPELAVVRALLERALRLDEDWEAGAIHEGMIALEGLPVLAGGSSARARKHFERAVELSDGQSALAYVTFALSVPLRAGNRAEFHTLLKQALAIDVARRPDLRLANLVAQKRARLLLGMGEKVFK